MFWTFLLAHLIGDYPLQTKRLVLAKQHLPGLTLHVGIHWITLTVLTWPVYSDVWPAVAAIAIAHFCIDAFKNYLGHQHPHWFIGPYFLDQTLHLTSLAFAALWVQENSGIPSWELASGDSWVAYGIGLTLATFFWYITELILTYKNLLLNSRIEKTKWPRMAARLLLFLTAVLVATAGSLPWFLVLAAVVLVAVVYRIAGYLPVWSLIDPIVAGTSAMLSWVILFAPWAEFMNLVG